ncbi:sensor histidine kinase [Niabella beijingensis]|uniref:sensor histidine kinase n=1 Tax=Niabella beijingensis TaxID=2872700 RepID=UPI001CC06A3B|nr:ATP-binding protein [Niabella beijingensis]MBZ4192618.1 hypothetical protein [Niabella beijingensis]
MKVLLNLRPSLKKNNFVSAHNRLSLKKILIAFLLFHLISPAAYGDNVKDSARKVISRIDRAYSTGRIKKKEYLDSVYTTMRLLLSANINFTNKEAIELLSSYRKTIWADDSTYEQKRNYYVILSNQAHMTSRMGEKLYYTEKIEKLERAAHNNRPSLSALSSLAGYYDVVSSPEKTIALYDKSKNYINKIPELAKKGELNAKDLGQAVILLNLIATAYYDLMQISNGHATAELMQQIVNIAREKYSTDNNLMSATAHVQILTAIKGASAMKDPGKQWEAIQQMEALRNNAITPQERKNLIDINLNFWKLNYFLTQHNHDSTARYLDIYRRVVENGRKPYLLFEYQTYKSKELYNLGLFKQSADTLVKAIRILDSSRSLLAQDVDNILYAQAEAEEKQFLLKEAAARQKATERKLILTGVALGLLFLVGIFVIRFVRHRQQARFLKFKMNLARNIHDEASPALLYAKALVRSWSNNSSKKDELEKQIDHTMMLIRSLSHDLRSDKQYIIANLIDDVEQLLQKLNPDNSFAYSIGKSLNEKRLISHYQYTELKAILNECITNTIKYAEFSKIEVNFEQNNNRFSITYKDNGEGWDGDKKSEGMGLKNIEERINGLNGDYKIQNQHPNGYSIQLSILLR